MAPIGQIAEIFYLLKKNCLSLCSTKPRIDCETSIILNVTSAGPRVHYHSHSHRAHYTVRFIQIGHLILHRNIVLFLSNHAAENLGFNRTERLLVHVISAANRTKNCITFIVSIRIQNHYTHRC